LSQGSSPENHIGFDANPGVKRPANPWDLNCFEWSGAPAQTPPVWLDREMIGIGRSPGLSGKAGITD